MSLLAPRPTLASMFRNIRPLKAHLGDHFKLAALQNPFKADYEFLNGEKEAFEAHAKRFEGEHLEKIDPEKGTYNIWGAFGVDELEGELLFAVGQTAIGAYDNGTPIRGGKTTLRFELPRYLNGNERHKLLVNPREYRTYLKGTPEFEKQFEAALPKAIDYALSSRLGARVAEAIVPTMEQYGIFFDHKPGVSTRTVQALIDKGFKLWALPSEKSHQAGDTVLLRG